MFFSNKLYCSYYARCSHRIFIYISLEMVGIYLPTGDIKKYAFCTKSQYTTSTPSYLHLWEQEIKYRIFRRLTVEHTVTIATSTIQASYRSKHLLLATVSHSVSFKLQLYLNEICVEKYKNWHMIWLTYKLSFGAGLGRKSKRKCTTISLTEITTV